MYGLKPAPFKSGSDELLFRLYQVADGFPAADQPGSLALDQDFRGAGPGVVIGAERHSISSGVQNRHQVPFFYLRQFPIPGKEVSGLTDWADDVHHGWLRLRILDHRQNLMVGLVE